MSARFSEANGPSLTPPSRVVKTTSYGPGALSQRIQLTRDSFANRSRLAAGARAERLRGLLARVDRELAVRVAEGVLDRLRAEEERRRRLTGRPALGEQARALELLRRAPVPPARLAAPGRRPVGEEGRGLELVRRGPVARTRLGAPGRLAGGAPPRPRQLRRGRRAEIVDHADRARQALAGVDAPPRAPQAGAVGEPGSRAPQAGPGLRGPNECLLQPKRETRRVGEERPAARRARPPPAPGPPGPRA